MAKVKERSKNWIIKKLGGYTAAEYRLISALPVQTLEVEPCHIDRLCCERRMELITGAPGESATSIRERAIDIGEWVKEQIAKELSRQMFPYIEFSTSWDCFGVQTIRGEVRVVIPNMGGSQ